MQHPLRVGQVFKSHKLAYVEGHLMRHEDGSPWVDWTRLTVFDGPHHPKVFAAWTEQGDDGWKRERKDPVEVVHPDGFADTAFEVIETDLCGGGSAHGPHDTFPDGHYVLAKQVDGDATVRFYQSGCFTCMIKPEDIVLVSGPEDKEGTWRKKNEYIVP